jgi:hypothetical protein
MTEAIPMARLNGMSGYSVCGSTASEMAQAEAARGKDQQK